MQRDYQDGTIEMRTKASKELVNGFLSNLKTALEQKRFKFDLKLIRRHSQLYRFCVRNQTRFLFIYTSRGKDWEILSPGQEISYFISSEDMDWSVILLSEPKGKGKDDDPFGFLISRDDYIKMKSGLTMNRMGLIRIKEKDLSIKNRFNSWNTFFQRLNL